MIWKASVPATCLFALVVAVAPPGNRSGVPGCRVEITEPRAGQEVAGRISVKGTGSRSPGTYLWIFLRRWDFEPLWWPQGEALWDEEKQQWRGFATLGKRVDIGWEFDLMVAGVGPEEHLQLTDYMTRGRETGRFRPMPPPSVICASARLRVMKGSK